MLLFYFYVFIMGSPLSLLSANEIRKNNSLITAVTPKAMHIIRESGMHLRNNIVYDRSEHHHWLSFQSSGPVWIDARTTDNQKVSLLIIRTLFSEIKMSQFHVIDLPQGTIDQLWILEKKWTDHEKMVAEILAICKHNKPYMDLEDEGIRWIRKNVEALEKLWKYNCDSSESCTTTEDIQAIDDLVDEFQLFLWRYNTLLKSGNPKQNDVISSRNSLKQNEESNHPRECEKIVQWICDSYKSIVKNIRDFMLQNNPESVAQSQ